MSLTHKLKSVLYDIRHKYQQYTQSTNCIHPNGHFYSPVFSIKDIEKRQDAIWKNVNVDGVAGIDLNTNGQIELVKQFAQYYNEIPFADTKKSNLRYQYLNGFYTYTDAIMLYSMMRHFKPKRIIEIGSGHSSAVMLDTNDAFFESKIDLTFIDPYADRLFSIMTENDKKNVKVIQTDVQVIDLDVFKTLTAGDILFIDSTHVSKTGSDVNYILFEILPVLNCGVYIHFHDIFYPFEYPKEWVLKGTNWNEDYILKAFLMYNKDFEIKIFADYLHLHHKNAFENMPLTYKNTGGNIWIQKK
jgi:hypothetical protein